MAAAAMENSHSLARVCLLDEVIPFEAEAVIGMINSTGSRLPNLEEVLMIDTSFRRQHLWRRIADGQWSYQRSSWLGC